MKSASRKPAGKIAELLASTVAFVLIFTCAVWYIDFVSVGYSAVLVGAVCFVASALISRTW